MELCTTRVQSQVAAGEAPSSAVPRDKEQLFELQLRNHKLEAELSAMQIRLRTYEQMQSLTELLKQSQKCVWKLLIITYSHSLHVNDYMYSINVHL